MSPVLFPVSALFLKMQEMRSKVHKKLHLKGKFEAEYNEFLQRLGAIIKARRIELMITQEELDSHPLPIDERNFRRIEAGTRNVTVKTLFAICKKLQIQPRQLFDFDINV